MVRLNLLSHFLGLPYRRLPRPKITLPDRSMTHACDDQKSIAKRRFVPEKY